MYGGILMRKYSYNRYMPYMRVRFRSHPCTGYANNTFIRDFAIFFRIIICIACLVAAISSIGNNFYAAVENISEYKAAQLVNEYIDLGILSASSLFADKSFVEVIYDKYGKVTSIETNGIEINRFASVLSESIQKEIKKREYEKIKVPLGSIAGNKLLASFGFSIPYRIIPDGKVSVSPQSVFEDAGINQTVHKLKMNVSVKVKILFPLMNREETIDREVIVSETVIVGDIPEVLLSRMD